MIKERFKLSSDNQNIYDTEEKCYYSSIDTKLCDLLNELEQERKDSEHYHSMVLKSYIGVSEENEQLKQKYEKLKYVHSLLHDECLDAEYERDSLKKDVNSLGEEREQLKKELRIYRKLASCENCGHHDYDWFDDGDEFEVCKKGNDMADRICEDWWEFD